ncbi:DNA-binding MarR family transcriptional regulator [Paraburkholderia sp. EB58]|jgi:DNA-binding MarR family transcriptional regulator|uniref:MarR family winged helix-turn-helix transcriptional regulator n=1 Tax=Paraburkholderia sp. EB58 TaxID=3035125 RepID=UPI003D1A1B94
MKTGRAAAQPHHGSPSVCVNAAIRRAARRMGQIYDDAFESCGLRATQYSLLVQIDRVGTPTMRVLADNLVMDLSALGHTLKPLIRDGLVELVVDEEDRRSRRVHLTKDGRHKLEEARVIWKKVQISFDDAFGKPAAAQLRATLDLIASPDFSERMTALLESMS